MPAIAKCKYISFLPDSVDCMKYVEFQHSTLFDGISMKSMDRIIAKKVILQIMILVLNKSHLWKWLRKKATDKTEFVSRNQF